jgi:hypothetical protein
MLADELTQMANHRAGMLNWARSQGTQAVHVSALLSFIEWEESVCRRSAERMRKLEAEQQEGE